MCRLLGVVSTHVAPLPALLGADQQPFCALSERHKDGWGLAYWDANGILQRERSPEQARSSSGYAAAVDAAHTDAALLHLRRASSGLSVETTNTHPFREEGVAFAHNGFATPTSALDALLAQHGGGACEGTTDSERYFRLVLALMQDMTPERALLRAAKLIALASRAEALNALLLTDDALYAIRADNPEVTLENGNVPAEYALHWAQSAAAVTIASTGWERDPQRWRELPNWHVLKVRRATPGGELRLTVHGDVVPAQ